MNWQMEVKRGGVVEQSGGGTLPDPIWKIGQDAIEQGTPKARVEGRISHWGDHVSISFSVSIECVQTQLHIQQAAQYAASETTRFVNELASRFDRDMPMLPTE